MSLSSLWGSFVRMIDRSDGRKCVGKDRAGNTFWVIPDPGNDPDPRRHIEYAGADTGLVSQPALVHHSRLFVVIKLMKYSSTFVNVW